MMRNRFRDSVTRKVVRLRDRKGLSWREVGNSFNVSPGTARRLYDEWYGYNAHFLSPRSNSVS
jgi:transposase